jgi:HSP20 family protein
MLNTRWQPFTGLQYEVDRLSDEMDRLFGGFRRRPSRHPSGAGYPPLNVWEDEGNLYVEAELPGIAQDDLEISVLGKQLTIKGERRELTSQQGTCYRRERGYGKFSRTLELPVELDADRVEARSEQGVLTITLPKLPEAQPRRINVVAQ